jgi:hypothetical protein
LDVGDQALMRGLDTALPRCVRGCPYLTAGVEQVGHIASAGNSLPWSRPRHCAIDDGGREPYIMSPLAMAGPPSPPPT